MNDKILEIFTAESEELIQAMEEGLLALENDPTDAEQIHSVFRAAHTIKGNAGFVGLEKLIDYAHIQENILDKLRQGQLEVSPKVISLLLESVDVLKCMIEASLSGTQADETRIQEMKSRLQTLAGQKEAIEERPAAADEESAPEEPRLVKINLALNEDIFLTGTDPLMLITELEDLGELVEIKADASGLPPLGAMNPHKLYTAWDVVLKTAVPLSQ
ncbi:MAG: Hpt domain-containing protein, partial [Deltaproteobacteria bacterium]|nr:Hpt domain-containing protein [Deltaproteobacteria bacterium]